MSFGVPDYGRDATRYLARWPNFLGAAGHRFTGARSSRNRGYVQRFGQEASSFSYSGVRTALESFKQHMRLSRRQKRRLRKSFVGRLCRKHLLRGGHMGAILFGSILLIAGIVGVLTARRSLEKGTERINSLAPNSDHRTALHPAPRKFP